MREDFLRIAAERLHRRMEWATRYGEPGLLPRLRDELVKAYDAIDALMDTLSRQETNGKNPRLMLRVASSKEICRSLEHGTGLIQYARGSDGLYAFLFTRESFNVFPLGDANEIDAAAINARRGLRTLDGGRFLAASRTLYSRLVGPFSASLHGLNHLTIVADGSLGLVPFEALVVTGADLAHAHYFVRDFDVSYALSATMYAEMQTQGGVHSTGQFAFTGFAPVFRSANAGNAQRNYIARLDPTETRSITVDGKVFNAIPYSGSEVRWIASHFASSGNKSLCELEEKATERSFKASAEHSKIIHVATHGFMDANNPDLSALLFSPTPDTVMGNDGILYAGEVYDLKLDADLVVLSSCESGVGRSVAGEGSLAMSRAFIYAGARNIAYSLWKVNDRQTGELMRKFYGRVLRGESFAHALAGAKREMFVRRSTANPFSWAGFVLMGD
jgi:CHAT domain-containing protein